MVSMFGTVFASCTTSKEDTVQFLFLIIASVVFVATPALANDPFVIGGSGIAETRVISHANALKRFDAIGVSVREVISGDTKVGGLLGLSGSEGLHAHTYASSAIADMNAGRVCSKLVAPLSIRYPSAIVAKVPTASELKGKEIGFYALQSVAGSALRYFFAEKGLREGDYIARQINVFTGKRIEHLFREPAMMAIHVAEPQASYLAHAQGLSVLSRIGDPSIPVHVASGLFVHCAHLDDPAKRAVVAKVIAVLKQYVRESPSGALSDDRQVWIASLLKADHEKRLKDGIGGFALNPVTLSDIAQSIIKHDAAIMPPVEWPEAAVTRTIAWALYPDRPKRALTDFFDRSLWEQAP